METGDVGNMMDFSADVQYMGTQLLRTIIAKLIKIWNPPEEPGFARDFGW